MATWLCDLTKQEKRTLWACFIGWALDAFDVMILSYALPTLLAIHFLTKPQAGLIGTAALLSSSFGGWLAGILCDRFGRVRLLQLTVAWFAVFTFLCGWAQNEQQLLLARSLQGLGFGGEWTVGSVLIAEVIRAKYRGKAEGYVQSSWGIGFIAAALVYGVVFSVFSHEIGWRVLFWIGLLPALFVWIIRKSIDETYIVSHKSHGDTAGRTPGFLGFLGPDLLPRTVFATIMLIGGQGGYFAVAVWLPQFLQHDRHLSVLNTSAYSILVSLGGFIGSLAAAHLADAIGRKPTVILSALATIVTAYIYMVLPIHGFEIIVLGVVLGAVTYARMAPMGAILSELFPTVVRGSAQGFTYNVGRAFGAFFPAIVGYLTLNMSLGLAVGVMTGVANALMILGCLFLPETRNIELA